MRTTWRAIRGVLVEVVRTGEEVIKETSRGKRKSRPETLVHERNIDSLRAVAIDRWLGDKATTISGYAVWLYDRVTRKDIIAASLLTADDVLNLTVMLDNNVKRTPGDVQFDIEVFAKVTDPLRPTLRVKSEWFDEDAEKWRRDPGPLQSFFEQCAAACKEVLSPTSDESGRWWADENYRPLRPVYEGEDVAFKPDPLWTLVDGTTGDVIKETKDPAGPVNTVATENVDPMRDAMRRRIKEWCDERVLPRRQMTISHRAVGSVCSVYVFGKGGGYCTLNVIADNVLEPYVELGEVTVGVSPLERAEAQYGLESVLLPTSDIRGYWWADKETFELFRPVYEGESPWFAPSRSVVAIDPHTYEPVELK